ncbi:hypothetical protein [Marinobacter vinifirmus]|uniref:Uncharacterized protein n=1 Tax=Marinobacter vinifirmus TaxID=355591 RepID=A0A558B383_9GAMM|nr:hypothetical protein [Marinobacter vinifirmus]TVT30971.1 MAG: hypothetical protein FHK81_16080 [Marinobacter vinifirmus]
MQENAKVMDTPVKSSIGERSLQAMVLAFTVGFVGAIVLLFAPWYSIEDPFFGLPITINGLKANSPTLDMMAVYPLIGLYVIALGCPWGQARSTGL